MTRWGMQYPRVLCSISHEATFVLLMGRHARILFLCETFAEWMAAHTSLHLWSASFLVPRSFRILDVSLKEQAHGDICVSYTWRFLGADIREMLSMQPRKKTGRLHCKAQQSLANLRFKVVVIFNLFTHGKKSSVSTPHICYAERAVMTFEANFLVSMLELRCMFLLRLYC